MRRPTPARIAWPLAASLLALAAGRAAAQLPQVDPLPFTAVADSSSSLALTVELGRFTDPRFDWRTNRALLCVRLPAGRNARFFLRIPYLHFDTGRVPLASRWPWVIGPEAGEGWPGETAVDGFGQLEIGVTGLLTLPLLGVLDYGVGLGTPLGSDRLYPLSSGGIPLQFAVRRTLRLGGGFRFGAQAGYVKHMDPAGEVLAKEAFVGGSRLGASLDWYADGGLHAGLCYLRDEREGRGSQQAGGELWLPWAGSAAVGLKAWRELAGTLDRHAAWYFAVAWRLDSLAHRPGRTPGGNPRAVQNAPPGGGS